MVYRDALGQCPSCHCPLASRTVAGHRINACELCGGLFVDNAVSQRLTREYERELVAFDVAWSMGKKTVARWPEPECPRCSAPMRAVTVERANVIVDVCAEHGTWFDPGELQEVARAYRERRKRSIAANGPPVTVEARIVAANLQEPPQMELAFEAKASEFLALVESATIQIVAVRLKSRQLPGVREYSHDDFAVEELTAREPQVWNGSSYRPWSQTIAAGQSLRVCYKLSALPAAAPPASKWICSRAA